MAEKQVEIEVVTKADLSEVEELEDAIESTKQSAEDLEGSLNVDSSNVESATSDVDELADSAENAATSLEDIQASMDLIESSALLGISNELSNIGSGAEGMAQDMNTAAISVGQLATNVGMAEPQMVSLINNISNATFPQNEAMAYVGALNQMGVSADKLGASATNMDRINDATGIGYTSVMQLTQGLRSVGVEADNLPSSFNAIAYAQANVNGGADTLGMVLKRQASTINEYGLSVDQTVLIMQKLSEQGVQGMKMGSELSKVLKETNGNTQELEKSLGMATGSLSNASSATGQYEGKLQALADEEAEHKTWLDQINAAWEDMSLAMSPVLAPMTSFMGLIGNAGSYAVGINGLVTLANTMRGLSLANIQATITSKALTVANAAQAIGAKAAAAAQWLLNIAMDANPVMLVVIAIGLLIAALAYLYFNNEQVRMAVDALGAGLQWLGNEVIGGLSQQFQDFTNQLGLNTNDWTQAVLGFILFIPQLPARLGIELMNALLKAMGFKTDFATTIGNAASQAVTNFTTWIGGIYTKFKEEVDAILAEGDRLARELPPKIGKAGLGVIGNWVGTTHEESPGLMYYKFKEELDAMQSIADNHSKALPGTINSMGSGIVNGFDTGNLNTSNNNVGGYGGVTINLEIGSVDNEDRVNEIVEAVRKALDWDNRTAGRTV